MSAPSSGRATWASGDDYTLVSLIVIVGGLCIYAWVAWTHYHPDISCGFAVLAHWHIAAIRLFTNEYDALDRQLLDADYSRVTLVGIRAAATSIGTFFRLPVSLLLILLAGVCMLCAAPTRFARRLDLDGLITEQARFFRTISAFADRHLGLAPLLPRSPRSGRPGAASCRVARPLRLRRRRDAVRVTRPCRTHQPARAGVDRRGIRTASCAGALRCVRAPPCPPA